MITAGFAGPTEEATVAVDKRSASRAKTLREGDFPFEIAACAIGFDVASTATTMEQDRTRILNCIAGRDQSEDAVMEDPRYEEFNSRIRSLFALTFWRRGLAGDGGRNLVGNGPPELLKELAEALHGDSCRTSLELDFSFCDVIGNTEVALVSRSLPPNLRELCLDLSGTKIAHDGLRDLADALPKQLRSLHLGLCRCKNLTDASIAAFCRCLPRKHLTTLKLRVSGTPLCERVREVCENGSLEDIRDLRKDTEVEVVKFHGERRGKFPWATLVDGGRYRYTATEWGDLEIWENLSAEDNAKPTLRRAKALVGKPGVRVMAHIVKKQFKEFDWEDAPDNNWKGKALYILIRWSVYKEVDATLVNPLPNLETMPLRIYHSDSIEEVTQRAHEYVSQEDRLAHLYGTVLLIKGVPATDYMDQAAEAVIANRARSDRKPTLIDILIAADAHDISLAPHPPPPLEEAAEDAFEREDNSEGEGEGGGVEVTETAPLPPPPMTTSA